MTRADCLDAVALMRAYLAGDREGFAALMASANHEETLTATIAIVAGIFQAQAQGDTAAVDQVLGNIADSLIAGRI